MEEYVWAKGHIRWNFDYDLYFRLPNILPLNRFFMFTRMKKFQQI